MEEKRNKITSKQWMVFVIAAQSGVGIFCQPANLAKEVGHDTWIPLLFWAAASILLCIIIIKLMRRYEDKSIYEIDVCIYGKYLGTVINIIIVLYLLLKAFTTLGFFTEITHTIVLPLTPDIVLTILVFIPVLYILWYGLKTLCRYSNLIFVILLSLIILYIAQLKQLKLEFLMPVGVCSIPSILSAMLMSAYSHLTFANVSIIYPYITDKEKAMKYTIYSIILTSLFFLVTSIVTTGFFGENLLKHITFPVYTLAQSFKAPVFERLDLFFFAIWFPAIGMTLMMYSYIVYHSINSLLRIKRKTISLIVVSAALIGLSMLPNSFSQVLEYINLSNVIGIPLTFGIAILDYILSFITKRGVKQNYRNGE